MPRKTNAKRKQGKQSQRVLQNFLKTRLVKKPKKRTRKLKLSKVKPVNQKGKGVMLGLLGGLIPLIADLVRRA